MPSSADGTEDGWEDTVMTYCLSLGLQFGFQTFASRKAPEGVQWYPSTTFIATHTLTEALRDVASRTTATAAAETAPSLAGLACAVRELHGTIFQPYVTWLKAAKLRPSSRPAHPLPNAESLNLELADLSLYWLVYSEGANLRHTPEMLWFIFFCAQRSMQAKQVLSHLRLHRAVLAELPKQPWLAALGPGLTRAVQLLHAKYRRAKSRGGSDGGSGGGGLLEEATLRLPGSRRSRGGQVDDASVAEMYGEAAAAAAVADAAAATADAAAATADAAAGGRSRSALRITVLADGSVSLPYSSYDKAVGAAGGGVCSSSGSCTGSPRDDAKVGNGARPVTPRSSRLAVTAGTLGSLRYREGVLPDSPSLPMPPSLSPGVINAPRPGSVFATPGAASGAASGFTTSAATAAAAAPAVAPRHLTSMGSSPTSPGWDPRTAAEGYRELLLRFCPNETAVAAVLSTDGGDGGSGSGGGGGTPDGGDRKCAGGGSSTPFLTGVVQPLFLFLSEQVFELGQARRQGLEAAVRIGYDDVSESMALPRVVAAALAALPWATTTASIVAAGSSGARWDGQAASSHTTPAGRGGPSERQPPPQQHQARQQIMPRAALNDEELYWSRLLALGDLPPSGIARIPWQGDMAHYRHQLLRLLYGGGGGGAAAAAVGASDAGGLSGQCPSRARGGSSGDDDDSDEGVSGDEEAPNPTVEQAAQAAAAAYAVAPDAAAELGSLRRSNAAADWWARHVLRKTFVEHRSLAMPLLAFARVHQFQLCWFYLLCVWTWSSRDTITHWIASAAALHWGTNCLLWTMQVVLSAGPRMKRGGAVIPFYASFQGRPRRNGGPSAPTILYGTLWWFSHLWLLGLCWGALAAGLYIAFIVWPDHSLYGYQCYPLLWERSCYWWIAVAYGGTVLLYEMLYRQLNAGGFARGHVYDILLRLLPGCGTASASSSSSLMYDPSTFLRTGLKYVLGNTGLWGCALALKFVIDYYILVRPAGPRLREILATDKLAWSFDIAWSWWPVGWSRHFTVDLDPCMAAAQVIVLFLLSLVSTGVSYSVAGAVWGALQGVYQGIGSIRHWHHIRVGFHRVQVAMRAKLLMPEETRAPEGRSLALRAVLAVFWAAGAVLLLPYTCVVWVLRWARCLPRPVKDQPKSWVQREETLAITAPFWNAVVRSMRGRDLLSDREVAALSFSVVSLSPASMMATWRRGGTAGTAAGVADSQVRQSVSSDARFQRETYLPPIAVYVAQIPHMIISGGAPTAEQLEVLQEAYLYLLHLLVAVGAVPRSEQVSASLGLKGHNSPGPASPASHDGSSPSSCSSATATPAAAAAAVASCPDLHKDNFHPDKFAGMPPRASSHRRLVARRELLGALVALVRALVEAGKAFKDTSPGGAAGAGNASPAVSPTAAASRGRAIDKLCMALHGAARCMTQMHDLPWSVSLIMNRVVVRQHYHQPAVKALLHRGFCSLVDAGRSSTLWGAEHMPSYEDFAKVSSWLLAILRPTDEGTAPSNSEAVALLAEFCSGLVNPDLPTAPRVDAMRSVSTLIPHYQETVMYALNSADARRVLERTGAPPLEGSLPDDEVLFKNDEGAPSELLQYLVSEFPDEFRNLLERCRTLVPLAKDDPPYVLEDFLPYGRLYEHRAQLLLWASFRGQVLARTVDGMCMYRTALAMQAVQDAMAQQGGPGGGGGAGSGNLRGRTRLPQKQQRCSGGGCGDGRLKLSGVQRMMVQGIMRDASLSVEELVAQLVDVIPALVPLLERKYSLVVSSQVFAKAAASLSLPDRWRAHGIALLATRYTAMRVAYLEQDGDALTLFKAPDFTYRVVHQASVLVRAVPLEREVESRRQIAVSEKDIIVNVSTIASPATTAPYGAGKDAGAGVAATPPSVTPTASWMDGYSFLDDNNSDDGGHGSGDDDDAGTMLRVWRRRHQLKHLQASELEVLFRQQLPVNYYDRHASGVGVILGEGKPENQNCAVPYCPGVLLQTIDMNQDNSLAQAFKLRNATREFEPLGPLPQNQHVAVLGYPEWIFSYRCGLLADLAAATERAFGTQIQRVMAYPSAVRAHYGHPDLWNRLFSMTRGGVSKANAVQHVSEDVFGGYNALKRGGLSKYVSYISVGKGRDMGLDSILGFEGKISKGCAEQLMSRDLRFLGCNTDFFRSMSLYFTVPGHFINTWLTVLTIRLGVWVQLLLLLGGVGKTAGSLASALGAIQILQLGTLPLIGYIFNLWLEAGMATALATLARQFVAGGLLFHIFRAVTSAFHLGRAVLFGGAGYVATGRGFSLRRKTFTQVYVNYGRSHLYLGADLLVMVVLILVVGNNGGNAMPIPAAALWSPMLVAVALLAGPFWFTPFFFRLNQVMRDTREFRSWLAGSAARGVGENWTEWNSSQLSGLRDDAGAQIPRYRFWSTAAVVLPRAAIAVLSTIVAVTGARFDTRAVPDMLWVLGGSGATWALLALLAATRKAYLTSGLAVGWRWAKGIVQVVALVSVVALALLCLFIEKKGLRFSGVLITLYANYQVASLLVCVWVMWLPKTMIARSLSNSAYRHADGALGTALSAVLIVICFIGEIGLVMVDKVQTLVQFNDRYSHTQAARPYAGDDDPTAAGAASGGGGGGGGGGLAAAAAVALRRRLPSNMMMITPPLSRGGGARGGRRTPGEGAAPLPSGSPSVLQGWVSPRFRSGGCATPVFMFTGTGAHSGATAADSPPTGTHALVATPASSAAGAAGVPAPQASGSASAPEPPAMSPRPPLQRQPSRVSHAAAGGGRASVSGVSGRGGSCGGAMLQLPPSRDLSWSSSTPPMVVRQGTGGSMGGGSNPLPQPAPGQAPRGDNPGLPQFPAKASRTRLPPSEEWRGVAMAAAEVAISRTTSQAAPLPELEGCPPRYAPVRTQSSRQSQDGPSAGSSGTSGGTDAGVAAAGGLAGVYGAGGVDGDAAGSFRLAVHPQAWSAAGSMAAYLTMVQPPAPRPPAADVSVLPAIRPSPRPMGPAPGINPGDRYERVSGGAPGGSRAGLGVGGGSPFATPAAAAVADGQWMRPRDTPYGGPGGSNRTSQNGSAM